MPDVQNLVGGAAPDILVLVCVDGTSITGNGSAEHPLSAVAGGVAVHVDGSSIAGNGTIAEPLHTVADGTAVAVDGSTIGGTGVTGSPLHVITNTINVQIATVAAAPARPTARFTSRSRSLRDQVQVS